MHTCMYSHLIVHEERCSDPLGNNQNNELKRGRVEGETGGGRNRRKEGEEEGGCRERFGEGGEGEGGTICTPLWILPGNHTLAESR